MSIVLGDAQPRRSALGKQTIESCSMNRSTILLNSSSKSSPWKDIVTLPPQKRSFFLKAQKPFGKEFSSIDTLKVEVAEEAQKRSNALRILVLIWCLSSIFSTMTSKLKILQILFTRSSQKLCFSFSFSEGDLASLAVFIFVFSHLISLESADQLVSLVLQPSQGISQIFLHEEDSRSILRRFRCSSCMHLQPQILAV